MSGDILQDLVAFGLTQTEAKVYVALLSFKEATINMLSHSTGLHVSQLYGILEKLEQKGFVIEQPGRPKVYRAVEPNIVLNRVLRDLSKRKERIVEELLRVKRNAFTTSVPPLWVIKGKKNILGTARDLVREAEIDILLSANHPLFNKLFEQLMRARDKGIQIFILLFPREIPKLTISKATKAGRVRLGRRSDFILIADSSSCVYIQHSLLDVLDLRGYAVLTEEPSLVDLFMHNFINRWAISKPINDELDIKSLPCTYTCHRLALSDIKWLMDRGYTVHVEVDGYETKSRRRRKIRGVARNVTMNPEDGMYNVLIETETGEKIEAGGIDAYIEEIAARTIKIWV